jgi:hypothetical protein
MTRLMTVLCAAAAAVALLVPAPAAAQAGRPLGDAAYDSAFFAWEAGDYPAALRLLDRLLSGPGAERYVRAAAELTGEVYATTELTRDGRSPRWSPDGRYAAYETGAGGERRTHIVAVSGGGVREVAVVAGSGLVFDGAGREAYVGGSSSSVVVRDLSSGRETRVAAPGLTVQAVIFGPGDGAVHVLAASAGGGSDVYRLGDAPPVRVTRGDGPKSSPAWLADGTLLYVVDRQTFGLEDTRTGSVREQSGAAVTVSADGGTVAYVRRDGADHVIEVMRVADGLVPRQAVRRAQPAGSPALTRDGRRLAYQAMPREDWEIYVADADGGNETRLTREIQHDVLPQFLNDSTVFAVMGEPRHRRSYLYDAAGATRTRLFHNNTVRTVAPEYEWVVAPDGARLLIVADRDGDTVSPERGVYLTDLTRPVTLQELRARVGEQLAHELALRERGRALFAGLEEPVREAVADVSKDRAYRYSHDLYRFDSKHITQPGNQLAIEYLMATLRQWGYEPELQWFEARPRGAPGTQPATVRTANVVAKLPGTVSPDVLYVVSSHFDSVERSPGADDNTSGTAALLEAARVLATRPQPATIHFAFFTGEESGLLGSREYVRRAVAAGDRVVGALNNDMIGFANDQRLDNTIRYANAGIRDIQHAAAFLFTDMITYDTKYYRGTDAHAYYDAWGDIFGGIGSYPILGNPHYHQAHDELETINHQLVAEVAKVTVATLMQLASVPSRIAGLELDRRDNGATVSWAALPERDIMEYVVEWGPADGPARGSVVVAEPGAGIQGLEPGDQVRVRAVNRRGAHGWDWARITHH